MKFGVLANAYRVSLRGPVAELDAGFKTPPVQRGWRRKPARCGLIIGFFGVGVPLSIGAIYTDLACLFRVPRAVARILRLSQNIYQR